MVVSVDSNNNQTNNGTTPIYPTQTFPTNINPQFIPQVCLETTEEMKVILQTETDIDTLRCILAFHLTNGHTIRVEYSQLMYFVNLIIGMYKNDNIKNYYYSMICKSMQVITNKPFIFRINGLLEG